MHIRKLCCSIVAHMHFDMFTICSSKYRCRDGGRVLRHFVRRKKVVSRKRNKRTLDTIVLSNFYCLKWNYVKANKKQKTNVIIVKQKTVFSCYQRTNYVDLVLVTWYCFLFIPLIEPSSSSSTVKGWSYRSVLAAGLKLLQPSFQWPLSVSAAYRGIV